MVPINTTEKAIGRLFHAFIRYRIAKRKIGTSIIAIHNSNIKLVLALIDSSTTSTDPSPRRAGDSIEINTRCQR